MFVGSIILVKKREVLANFFRDLMKDKLGAVGVSGRDPADDDDDCTLE